MEGEREREGWREGGRERGREGEREREEGRETGRKVKGEREIEIWVWSERLKEEIVTEEKLIVRTEMLRNETERKSAE